MDALEALIPLSAILAIFVGMPWLFLHYTTKWKQAKTLTVDDENLIDDLNDTARRLEERVITIERIMTAENPNWKNG